MSEVWAVSFFFMTGLVSGFASSAPIGPINLWLIEASIQNLASKLKFFLIGVIVVDLIFAATAIMGYYGIENYWQKWTWLGSLGALLIILMGLFNLHRAVREWGADRSSLPQKKSMQHRVSGFFLGVVLCVSNPGFLMFWLFIVAASHQYFPETSTQLSLIPFLLGVLMGDLFWFRLLISLIKKGTAISSGKWVDFIRVTAASIFIIFGLAAFIGSLVENN